MRRVAFWVLLAIVLFLALVTGSFILYRLAYVLTALAILSYVGTFLTARRLEGGVDRLTPYLQVGEPVEDRLTLRNLGWWPKLMLEVEHRTELQSAAGRVVSLWPRRSGSWVSRDVSRKRGIARYGDLDVTARDPLGLFSRGVRTGRTQTALVYPATVELTGFHVPSGHVWGEGAVRGRTYLHSPIASGVREYVSGDSFSRIHWRTTARTGKLMSKDFEPEPAGPSQDIWLLLDLWEPAQAGEGAESTVEYAVTIAASIAKRYLDLGRTVGLVAGGEERVVVKAGTGQRQLGRIMEALAVVEAGPVGPLAGIVTAAAGEVVPKASVVVITPEGGAALSSAVNVLKQKGATVITITLDAASFRGETVAAEALQEPPDSNVEAYVIHRGDEIQRKLGVHGREPLPDLIGLALERFR